MGSKHDEMTDREIESNSMSHTKGPWIMRHTMLQDGHGGIEERSVVHYDSSQSDEFIARKIKTDANAHLIASAPDLLAALNRLLNALKADKDISPNMPVVISWETNGEAIRQAIAAIAKAEGRE